MGRRTLLLVAALLLAAIGTGVLFVYIRATVGSVSGPPSGNGTTLVIAPAAAVAAGTKIDESVEFRSVSVDATLARTAGMLTSAKGLQGLVANQALPALVPVTGSQFGGPVKESTELSLPKGTMAITVEMNDPNRVSTFLRKGSQVAVFLVDPEPRPDGKVHEARLVLPQVTVLTLGSSGTILNRATASPSAGAGSGSGSGTTQQRASQSLVTLQVTQEEAGKILVAQVSGELYFTLLGPGTTATPKSYDQTDVAVG